MIPFDFLERIVQRTPDLALIGDAFQGMLDEVLQHLDRRGVSLLDWELSRDRVHVLGDLGTAVTICHGLVPVLD